MATECRTKSHYKCSVAFKLLKGVIFENSSNFKVGICEECNGNSIQGMHHSSELVFLSALKKF
jgi:hypothetical protein